MNQNNMDFPYSSSTQVQTFIQRVYQWMAIGLALTGFTAFGTASNMALMRGLAGGGFLLVMLVELGQLPEDPLLSLLLEVMDQHKYFATQGGAVHLVFLDTTTQDPIEAERHTETTLANVNLAHKGATKLSRPEIASDVLAGEIASEALTRIAPHTKGVPAPVIRIGARPATTPTAESEVTVFAPALRAALDIASAPPAERVGVAATMQERYGVTVAPGPSALVPYLPLPTVVPVPADMEQRLRTFRAIAGNT